MTKRTWFSIRAQDGEAEILIYDEIGFFGVSAKDFMEDLKAVGEVERITVRINSPGGDVFGGLAIYNALKRHEATITVFIDGIAASIASVIAMAGDQVVMPENAMMMIHNPIAFVIGPASAMRKMAAALDKIERSLVSAYRAKTGLEAAAIEAFMDDETWFSAAEAVEQGFADEIEEPVKMAASATAFDLTKFRKVPEACRALFPGDDRPEENETMTDKDDKAVAAAPAAAVTDPPAAATDPPAAVTAPAAPAAPVVVALDADAIRAEGATAERERIAGIRAEGAKSPGNDAIIDAHIAEGKTAGECAQAILAALAERGPAALDRLRQDLPGATERPAVPAASSGADVPNAADHAGDIDSFTAAAKAKFTASAELQAEFASFEQYLAFAKATASGKVRVLRHPESRIAS